jgi:hypothetical protein
MKTRVRLLVVAAVFAVLAVATAPIIAAPNVQFAVLELKQNPDGALLAKQVVPNNLELAIFLVKGDTLPKTTAQFADNEKSSATLRRVLIVKTEGDVYAVVAMSRAMSTQMPDNIVTAQNDTTRLGGRLYQVNTRYDKTAATTKAQNHGWTTIT